MLRLSPHIFLIFLCHLVVVAALPLHGAAQELPKTGHFVCCQCGSFFEHDEWDWGVDREVIAMCPDCAEKVEEEYGSLEEAATALGDQCHELGLEAQQKRSAWNQANEESIQLGNDIFGFNGSMARFYSTLAGVLTVSPGVRSSLQWLQTGIELAQDHGDYDNWADAAAGVSATDAAHKRIEAAAHWKFLRDLRAAENTLNFVTYGEDLQRAATSYSSFSKGSMKHTLTGASYVLNVKSFAEATDDFSTHVTDVFVLDKEMRRLYARLQEIDALIESLIAERQCILGEIARRNEGDGDGGDGEDHGGDDRMPLPFADAANHSVSGAPPDGREGLEMLEWEPLPSAPGSPLPVAVLEAVLPPVQSLLESLEAHQLEFGRQILPDFLAVMILALEGTADDAERASQLCAELLPRFQSFEGRSADLVKAAHAILQRVYDGTREFGQTDEERARFQFINSGVNIERSDGLPDHDEWGWCRIVQPGVDPNLSIELHESQTKRMVLPGTYDMYWAQGLPQRERPLLIQENVEIQDGEFPTVRIDSGAKIVAADWVPAIDDGWGWWGAAPAGAAFPRDGGKAVRINWATTDDVPIVLPPGEYDIYWAQGISQRDNPVVIASGVSIQPGELASIPVNSGIRLTGEPEMDGYGWWAIVPAGGTGDGDWINISKGVADQPLVVGPGTYDILYDAGLNSDIVRIAENVTVRAGQLLEVPVR